MKIRIHALRSLLVGLVLVVLLAAGLAGIWQPTPALARWDGGAGTGPGGVGATDGSSTLELWLMADAGTFIDTGCSTAAGNGQDVACWQDQRGNSQDVTQSTSTRQPNYYTAVQNGLPALTYVGGADRDVLYRNFSPFSGNQPYTIFSAFNPSNTNYENLFAIGSPSTNQNIAYHPYWSGVSGRCLYHFGDATYTSAAGTVSGWQFAAFRYAAGTGTNR